MSSPDGPSRDERRAQARRHIDPSLLMKVRIYLIVFLVVAVLGVVDAVRGSALTWVFFAGGLVAGMVVGVLASRMQSLTWNDLEQRVVGRFDAVGVVVLVLYIVFALNRSRLVSAWVPAMHVPATSLAVLAGVMLGQVVGVRRGLLNLRRRVVGRPPQTPSP